MIRIIKIPIFTLIFLTSLNASALVNEFNIPRSNTELPLITIKNNGNRITWSAFKSEGVYSVGLYYLVKWDAEQLLNISRKAKESYSEIKKIGRCPDNTIKSGLLGKISSDNGSDMSFEVECKKNNIMLQIRMSDKYVVNFITSKVEWQDLEKLALEILSHY